ncbi:hypothetical protein ACFFHM_23525 [Halalkalibacter kiskunsagensis]|uniref:Uncharacterized protein n=1 Tax=Halalkalibacter kiskunsagensis TaxID=1548599 RepID=A0ABV6KJ82_9BACI
MMRKSNLKKVRTLLLTSVIISSSLLYSGPVFATENTKELETLLMDWEESGIDSNHIEAIDTIRNYLDKHVDDQIFSSLHIDREERPFGIIVLSFTKELSIDKKQEIEALIEEPSEVEFRVVTYTEQELLEKQHKIDSAIFEKHVFNEEEITVYHTGINIITNKIEIGISPYNELTSQSAKNYFNSDMIEVVEGGEAVLLDTELNEEVQVLMPISTNENDTNIGVFSKIKEWFVGLFAA